MLAQLHVTLADGKKLIVATDESWLASNQGPITAQSQLDGDTIDARKAWDFASPGFSHATFAPVKMEAQTASPALVAQVGPTIQKIDELPVARVLWKLDNGDHVFDLGQNMVGVIRLKLRGTSGQTIVATYGEVLKGPDDRAVYTVNLRGAKATDTFILSGHGEETFEPLLTLHGFRYVQLSGLTREPQKNAVTGLVYHSHTPATGSFSCSHEKPQSAPAQHRVWGQKGNFVDVPTDCPSCAAR